VSKFLRTVAQELQNVVVIDLTCSDLSCHSLLETYQRKNRKVSLGSLNLELLWSRYEAKSLTRVETSPLCRSMSTCR
jgi:hypothetical protein